MDYQQAKLFQDLIRSGATIEDLARAYASLDGKVKEFDTDKNIPLEDDSNGGHYLGFVCEMEEIISRAISYAYERKVNNVK